MALVELLLSPLPAHVRTSRLVVLAAARRAGLDDSLVDELRLAVGEACSRAVGLHARYAPNVPVKVTIADDPGRLTVTVADAGPQAGPAPDDLVEGIFDSGPGSEPTSGSGSDSGGGDVDEHVDPDVALAVLSGLLDSVEVVPAATGTTITMHWPLPAGARGPGGTAAAQA
jgi:serine/threonine-protein kinase RsbW